MLTCLTTYSMHVIGYPPCRRGAAQGVPPAAARSGHRRRLQAHQLQVRNNWARMGSKQFVCTGPQTRKRGRMHACTHDILRTAARQRTPFYTQVLGHHYPSCTSLAVQAKVATAIQALAGLLHKILCVFQVLPACMECVNARRTLPCKDSIRTVGRQCNRSRRHQLWCC